MKAFLLVSLLLLSAAFANNYDDAIKEFKDFPSNINAEVKWVEPFDKTYYPYDRCANVDNFEVVKLEEKVKYYF